jgi:hypothetical protein
MGKSGVAGGVESPFQYGPLDHHGTGQFAFELATGLRANVDQYRAGLLGLHRLCGAESGRPAACLIDEFVNALAGGAHPRLLQTGASQCR